MENEQKPNYQMLFIMGITFVGAGIAIGFPALMVLGLIFMTVGLVIGLAIGTALDRRTEG